MKTTPPYAMIVKLLALVIAALGTSVLHAEVQLASPFTSYMVLQRDMKVPVWGTAAAGETVTVEFAGQKQTATAGADGKWRVDLNPLTTSATGQTLVVSGSQTAQPVTLEDVLVGEVWLASGQSNMVFTVAAQGSLYGVVNQDAEIAAANYPQIRMFTAKDTKMYEPQANVTGTWEVCSPDTVGGFSAVGYLFARDLYLQLKVPVGIVTVASGASTAEAWVSREATTADAQMKPLLDSLDASVTYYRAVPQGPASGAPVRPTPINKPRAVVNVLRAPRLTDPTKDQHMPTVLFNGMLNAVIPYAIRGVLWYQGESIVGGTPGLNRYGHVLEVLIKDWRTRWGEGDIPFYLVQLPGQQNVSNNPRIREEQAKVLEVPNTGMAVTIDLGEEKNVHPHNKQPLGYRLMCIALAKAYGWNIEYSGPVYQSMKVEGGAARITFTHTGGGLVAKGGPLKGFQIAGADQKFVDAEAKIDGDTVVVSSPSVTMPVAVRYAWDSYPEGLGCNLYNSYDLPAGPFRTDAWDFPIVGIVEN